MTNIVKTFTPLKDQAWGTAMEQTG